MNEGVHRIVLTSHAFGEALLGGQFGSYSVGPYLNLAPFYAGEWFEGCA
jgi:hypothetical protein